MRWSAASQCPHDIGEGIVAPACCHNGALVLATETQCSPRKLSYPFRLATLNLPCVGATVCGPTVKPARPFYRGRFSTFGAVRYLRTGLHGSSSKALAALSRTLCLATSSFANSLSACCVSVMALRAHLTKRAPRHGQAPPVRRRPSSKSPIPLDKKHNAHVIYTASALKRRISDTMQVNITTRHDIRLVDVVLYFRDGTNYGFTTRTQGHSYYGALEPMNHNAHHIVGRKMYEVKKFWCATTAGATPSSTSTFRHPTRRTSTSA